MPHTLMVNENPPVTASQCPPPFDKGGLCILGLLQNAQTQRIPVKISLVKGRRWRDSGLPHTLMVNGNPPVTASQCPPPFDKGGLCILGPLQKT